MSALTGIEWTERTWNPVRGCTRVSEGCRNCYAERQAIRQGAPGGAYFGLVRSSKTGPRWTGRVEFVRNLLDEPFSWRKPSRIFVNSMSDLFHESVHDVQIAAVFGAMALATHHTFQVLTKRARRARVVLSSLTLDMCLDAHLTLGGMGPTLAQRRAIAAGTPASSPYGARSTAPLWPLPNVELLVSVEDQETANERIGELLATPAAVRGVSYEPAIGPVSLGLMGTIPKDIAPSYQLVRDRLHWVIVGGESGPGARPFDLAWAREIVEECRHADVPVFVKQLGARPIVTCERNCTDGDPCRGHAVRLRDRKGGDPAEWPKDLRVRQYPGELS